jgi:beta-phosphoglucomutase-like phosphatase (HAD superfamily)
VTFSAILFDCDGVLVDSEAIYVEVEREHLRRIGLNYALKEYQNRFNGLTSTDFFKALEQDYMARGKGPFPGDFADNLDAETKRRMDLELEAIAGAAGMLEVCNGPKAVASSSRLKRLHAKLRQTGLFGYFDPHIYSGEQVENGKPAPDLFLHAATALDVEPASCLVIEDSVNGVLAGRAAGMTVWGFVGGGHANEDLERRLFAAGASEVLPTHRDLASRISNS